MKNKGFTLIELIAVIIILAIIALITTPVILNVIQTSRENAFVDTAYNIISAAQKYQVSKAGKNEQLDLTIDYTNNQNTGRISLSGELPDSGTFHIDENGKSELALWSDKAHICVTKTKTEKKITKNKKITKENCNLSVAADQLIKTVVTTGDGLYESEYEEGEYIYRGEDPGNYIIFNEELWRIMSLESDGTLKIRRVEALTGLPWDAKSNRSSSTSTYCTQASSYGCNAWAATNNLIGSPTEFTQYYPNGNPTDNTFYSGTVINDSTMNTYLNETYYNTLSDKAKSYIVEGTFDVSTPGNYDSIENISYDVQQVKQYQWKGKIALMTITEWMQTSTDTGCTSLSDAYNGIICSNNNWMLDRSTSYEWSLSPRVVWASSGVWCVQGSGYITMNSADGHNAARPVVYLTSNIKLSGSGSLNNPYIIIS